MTRLARLSAALLVLLLPFSQADLTISDGGLAEGQSLFYSFDFSWGQEISYPGRAEIDVVTDGHGTLIDGGPPIDLAGKNLHPWLSPEADEVFTRSDYTQLFRATANEMLWSVGVDTAVVDNVINHTKYWDAEIYSTRMDQLYYGPFMAQRSCGPPDSDVDTTIVICPTKTNSGQRDPLKKGWYLHFVTEPFVYRLVAVGCKTSCLASDTCNAGHHKFYENFKNMDRMADRYCGCDCSGCLAPTPTPSTSPSPTPSSSPSPTPFTSPSPTPSFSPSPTPSFSPSPTPFSSPFPSPSPSPSSIPSPSPSPSPTPSPQPLCPEVGFFNFEFQLDSDNEIIDIISVTDESDVDVGSKVAKAIDDDSNKGCGSGNPAVYAVGFTGDDLGDTVIGVQVPGYDFDGTLGYALYRLNTTAFGGTTGSPFQSDFLTDQPGLGSFTYLDNTQYEKELVYVATGGNMQDLYLYTFKFLEAVEPAVYGSDGFGVAVFGQLQSPSSTRDDTFEWVILGSTVGTLLQNCETDAADPDDFVAGNVAGGEGENFQTAFRGNSKNGNVEPEVLAIRLCIAQQD